MTRQKTDPRRIELQWAAGVVASAKANAPAQIAYPADDQLDARTCLKGDPDRFFSDNRVTELLAVAECWRCPLRSWCLDRAMRLKQTDKGSGVWGATTATQRRAIVRRQAAAKERAA